MQSWLTLIIRIIPRFTAALLIAVIVSNPAYAQLSTEDEGVSWEKTLRIRGVMSRFDPFNESKLYKLSNQNAQRVPAREDFVQFGMVASNFWTILRDSLENAIRDNRVDVYTLRDLQPYAPAEQTTIYGKGTKVTHNDLLDTLSTNLTGIDHEGKLLYNLQLQRAIPEQSTIRRLSRSQGRLMNDFGLLTMYEVEIKINVDETGFNLQPMGIIFGTTHWPSRNEYEEDNLLNGFISGVELNRVGFYIDMTDEKTLSYLVENGLQVSGEHNVIPFYDLITMFHYEYKIFAESNNVVAQGALDFNYDLQELEQTLLNRYNELTFNNLYGQPPEWWDQGEKGHFTNGLYEAIEDMQQQNNNQQQNNRARTQPNSGGN